MGVECKSVILVGIPYSKATWDNLTDDYEMGSCGINE